MYIEILCCLRDAVTRKCPEKWRTNSGFHLHDNPPAHQSISVKGFLAKNNVTTMEHTPYSTDLAPADFYLFPPLKSALKGWHCDATDIINPYPASVENMVSCFNASRWQIGFSSVFKELRI